MLQNMSQLENVSIVLKAVECAYNMRGYVEARIKRSVKILDLAPHAVQIIGISKKTKIKKTQSVDLPRTEPSKHKVSKRRGSSHRTSGLWSGAKVILWGETMQRKNTSMILSIGHWKVARRILAILISALVIQSLLPHVKNASAEFFYDESNHNLSFVSTSEELSPDPIYEPAKYENMDGAKIDARLAIVYLPENEDREIKKSLYMTATAYSSDVWQTDDSPFIAADGSTVYWGMVATNILPMHTLVKFPELFGDKVFKVHDRMNSRYDKTHIIDVWHPTKDEAVQFGAKVTKVEILKA